MKSSQQKPKESKKSFKSFIGKIGSILTCPWMSQEKVDELKTLVGESEKIHARLAEAEANLSKMIHLSAEMDRKFTKGLHLLFKDLSNQQKESEKKAERQQEAVLQAVEVALEKMGKDVSRQTDQAEQAQKILENAARQVSGIDGTIGGIRDYLAKITESTRRYEEGYDFQILKNFVRQIARAISDLDRNILKASENVKPALIEAKEDLIELLYKNGVEQIIPDIEVAYHGMEGFAEVCPEKVSATDLGKRGKVAEVTRLGYKYTFDTGKERVIQSAMVKLYE